MSYIFTYLGCDGNIENHEINNLGKVRSLWCKYRDGACHAIFGAAGGGKSKSKNLRVIPSQASLRGMYSTIEIQIIWCSEVKGLPVPRIFYVYF